VSGFLGCEVRLVSSQEVMSGWRVPPELCVAGVSPVG
jgi:hypothetical protein